jgi:hypothetical protein
VADVRAAAAGRPHLSTRRWLNRPVLTPYAR